MGTINWLEAKLQTAPDHLSMALEDSAKHIEFSFYRYNPENLTTLEGYVHFQVWYK